MPWASGAGPEATLSHSTGAGWAIQGVPSHPSRLRDRGVDVVSEMTRVLARHADIPTVEMITRHRLGTPQNHLNRDERISNVNDAFAGTRALTSSVAASGPKHVILLDDVVTTGATMDACASLLEKAGHTVFLLAMAFRRELFSLEGKASAEREWSGSKSG